MHFIDLEFLLQFGSRNILLYRVRFLLIEYYVVRCQCCIFIKKLIYTFLAKKKLDVTVNKINYVTYSHKYLLFE